MAVFVFSISSISSSFIRVNAYIALVILRALSKSSIMDTNIPKIPVFNNITNAFRPKFKNTSEGRQEREKDDTNPQNPKENKTWPPTTKDAVPDS